MRVEFLGTGGAITTPKPGCDCRICVQARQLGVPYSRTGPCLFVHGPNLLIDTPEEIKFQLNRAGIVEIAACLYSHWHPDHVMGRRVWEMNKDWRGWPPRNRPTDIYLPAGVLSDFHNRLGTGEHLDFLAGSGVVRVMELPEGASVEVGGTVVTPIRLAEPYAYAFLLEADGRRLFIAPDELRGWSPSPELGGIDLAVVPMGIAEYHPLDGVRRVPENHPLLRSEATFRETLHIVTELKAERTVMTHIEEPDGLSYDDLLLLSGRLQAEGISITFAYDTLLIDV